MIHRDRGLMRGGREVRTYNKYKNNVKKQKEIRASRQKEHTEVSDQELLE
jgi:hypothetical protein